MKPALLAAALLLLLAAPTALGGRFDRSETPAATSPYASVDHVTYYMVAGVANGSALASDPGTGESVLAFDGCAFVQLRPALGRGRISIAGLVDGFTPVRVEVGDFEGNVMSQGPIATNLTLDAAYLPVLAPGQTAAGEAAGKALAQMEAAEHFDPERGAVTLANFTDPVGGGEDLEATLAMAKDGVRDDGTGARLDKVAGGDEELHLVLRSPAGVAPNDEALRFYGPPDLPSGLPATDAEYTESYEFLNTRFGGIATVRFDATAKAPPGFNAVTLVVRAPDGGEAANTTVEWSALAAGTASLEFPADQMGFYTVLVTGKLMLASYTIDVTLGAAPSFQLDFWWEDVVRGAPAQTAYGDCQRDIGMRAQVVAGTVDRATPPSFPLEVVVVGIAAAAIAALLVVKLVQDQVSSDAFRKMKK
ncbi:MAG TPA: hypothetical protein VM327_10075 [Candidatus Thermoplasmatota archaeon]|nr:hypothetical protein [Candidatus Thermoplasmatota archaeon]